MATLHLTKSGKGLIFITDNGSFMTSVAYVKMLIEGKANGNFIMLNNADRAQNNGVAADVEKVEEKPKGMGVFG